LLDNAQIGKSLEIELGKIANLDLGYSAPISN